VLAVLDAKSGKVVGSAKITEHVDQAAIDLTTHTIYCAGAGWLSVLRATPAGAEFVGNVKTADTAKNVAVDPATHAVWTTFTDGKNSYAQSFVRPDPFARGERNRGAPRFPVKKLLIISFVLALALFGGWRIAPRAGWRIRHDGSPRRISRHGPRHDGGDDEEMDRGVPQRQPGAKISFTVADVDARDRIAIGAETAEMFAAATSRSRANTTMSRGA